MTRSNGEIPEFVVKAKQLLGCVYIATNSVNGKKYVGKAVGGITGRKKAHLLAAHKRSKLPFHCAILKYGYENFVWEAVFYSRDNKLLLVEEIRLIRELGTRSPAGYNLTDGGEGRTGFILSKKTKKKISRSLRGRRLTEQHKRKIRKSTKLATTTEEYRRLCSIRHKGRKWKRSQRRRFALTKVGELNPAKRPEVARKISRALTGRHLTDEHKKKVSESLKGRRLSADSRRKISDAKRGIPFSEAHRASLKAAWVQRRKNALKARTK